MKAICVRQFGGPEVLEAVEIPDLVPRSGQVLVRIFAAGVNPVETYVRSGQYARLPALPYTPGSDGAGVIVAAGGETGGWTAGDRVYVAGSVSGTYAEQALAEAAQVHPLPDSISFEQGAALGVPYVTAHFALFHRGQARAGETVLIRGATGGVGLAAVQLAKAAGLVVLATGGSEKGRRLARQEGADHVFDHHDPDVDVRVREASEMRGPDLILEMLANANLASDAALTAQGGRTVVIGSRGPAEINPRDLMSRNSDVRGVMLGGASAEVLSAIHRELAEGLKTGALRPVVAERIPLTEASRAHIAVMASGASGKIVLLP